MSATASTQRMRACVQERVYAYMNAYRRLLMVQLRFCFSRGASVEVTNRKGASVWDYAIDNSDNSLLTTLVKAYRMKKGMADKDQLTFEGT